MTWIERWHDVIADKPVLPGIWRRRDGGFHVRARVTDPRTGKMLEIRRALPDVRRASDALQWLQAERTAKLQTGPEGETAAPHFRDYAATILERKIGLGRIRSAAGRAKWASAIATHLIPAFGPLYVDQMQPSDVKTWQSKVAARIQRGELSPATANTALAVLRQILGEAVNDYDMRDPMRGVNAFDTRGWSSYTEESPNSLAPADVPRFLAAMRELHPAHYAFTFIGLSTGLRPSSLRPLRRSGPDADVKWDTGILLIRRSHTLGSEVMPFTKTAKDQRLHMPEPLVEVLRWHVNEQLLHTKMRMSELLFPATTGGFRSRSCLDKPFAEVGKAIGLAYDVTPRAMRRTFQDLSRAAGVADLVTRAISGHATEAMQRRYSTVGADEVRDGLARVIDIATARRAG